MTGVVQESAGRGGAYSATALGTVLLGGLIGGALDLTFAFVFYGLHGITPKMILQGIASGALGKGSVDMGWTSAAAGAFFHFLISACAALIYYLISLHFPFLRRRVVLAGAIFGVLMFLTMRLIVLPLSTIGFTLTHMHLASVIGELCSHMFLFGMVIAYAASRATHHIRSSGTANSL